MSLEHLFRRETVWGLQKNSGSFLEARDKEYSTIGSVLGPPIYGNTHLDGRFTRGVHLRIRSKALYRRVVCRWTVSHKAPTPLPEGIQRLQEPYGRAMEATLLS